MKGHDIELRLGAWVYSDTGEPCTENRACGFCGKVDTIEGHDGCIGTLKGVINACCGHGLIADAYVQFPSRKRISGQAALDFINKEKENEQ